MSNKDIILKNPAYKWERDIFGRNQFSSEDFASFECSSFSCLSGLQWKRRHTVLVSFQVKTSLICSLKWVNTENLPLDSRLGWTVGNCYSWLISLIRVRQSGQNARPNSTSSLLEGKTSCGVTAELNSSLCETSMKHFSASKWAASDRARLIVRLNYTTPPICIS